MVRRGVVLAALIAGLVLLFVTRDAWLPGLALWLDVGQCPEPIDYVMVLPGDENTRPFAAAVLFKAGWAKRVLVPKTGLGPGTEDGVLPPAHEVICTVLRQRGVPEDRIVVWEGTGTSTYGDVQTLADFLDAHPAARVAVLTSEYHTRRVRWTLDRVLGPRAGQVQCVSAPTDSFFLDRWWKSPDGFVAIVGENARLGFYVVRYGRLGPGLACALGAVGLAVVLWRFGALHGFRSKASVNRPEKGQA